MKKTCPTVLHAQSPSSSSAPPNFGSIRAPPAEAGNVKDTKTVRTCRATDRRDRPRSLSATRHSASWVLAVGVWVSLTQNRGSRRVLSSRLSDVLAFRGRSDGLTEERRRVVVRWAGRWSVVAQGGPVRQKVPLTPRSPWSSLKTPEVRFSGGENTNRLARTATKQRPANGQRTREVLG